MGLRLSEEDLLKRMDTLCDNFKNCVEQSNKQGRSDSPARHFHIATINRLRNHGLVSIFEDRLYFEYLYATLATWGMDSRGAKLKGFESFIQSIISKREQIIKLNNYSIASLVNEDAKVVNETALTIWQVISELNVNQTNARLVAGTKTLHHLLPDLVPPIDRKYTLQFFFERKTISNAKADFVNVFENYIYIFDVVGETIRDMLGKNPLNSSVTKIVDNAIIAYQAKGKPTTWTS